MGLRLFQNYECVIALGEVVDSANETGLKDLLDNQAKIVECSDASYGDPSLALRPAREGIHFLDQD